MIEKMHEHIVLELQQNTRTDTIFIVISAFLNLIILLVNSINAGNDSKDVSQTIVLIIFIMLSIVINTVVIFGLQRGKRSRAMLLAGLIEMYREHGIDKYYNIQLLKNYDVRYNLFTIVIVFMGIVSISVPLVLW